MIMRGNLYVLLTFTGSILSVLTQNDCPLADQPYKDDLVMEKIIGRWYLVYMTSSNQQDPRTGTVMDATRENGTTYLQVTYLNSEGECGNVIKLEVRQTEPGKYMLYSDGEKVADSLIIATNYHTYALGYFCTEVEGGTCKESNAHIWSRTKDLSDDWFSQAVRQLERACLPTHVYIYKPDNYDECPSPEDNKDSCKRRNIPFLSNFNPDRLLGRWHLKHWYHGPGGAPQFRLQGSTTDIFKRNGSYFHTDHIMMRSQCLMLSRGPLWITPEKGQLKQYGSFEDGLDRYVVAADYSSYLLEWMCRATSGDDVCTEPFVRLWSRYPTISPSSVVEAETFLKVLCGHDTKITFDSVVYETCPSKTNQDPRGPLFSAVAPKVNSAGFLCILVAVGYVAIFR